MPDHEFDLMRFDQVTPFARENVKTSVRENVHYDPIHGETLRDRVFLALLNESPLPSWCQWHPHAQYVTRCGPARPDLAPRLP